MYIEIRVWDVEHNKYIRIKIKHETWIAKQFIATYVRNLNYKTTCFGLWRPSSGPDSGILLQDLFQCTYKHNGDNPPK